MEKLFNAHGQDIAAIILEPYPGNMNLVKPELSFIAGLRQLCDHYSAVLIFDEVMSGFRVALGGAQEILNIAPDLSTFGKIIGGGMPVGAFGGRREIMEHLSPVGKVYQAGTLSGNPIAMSAGLATLNGVCAPGFYQKLTQETQQLLKGLEEVAAKANIPFTTQSEGGMFGFYFTTEKSITTYAQVQQCNMDHFKHFFQGMLRRGIYLAPSAYEAGFMSSAHGEKEISKTITAAAEVFQELNH